MYLSDRIPEVYGFSPCCTVQASPDKGSHGKSARKRQERDSQYYKEIEMNIKKKDRKEQTKGKYRQTEIQTERQIYKKCARMKERRRITKGLAYKRSLHKKPILFRKRQKNIRFSLLSFFYHGAVVKQAYYMTQLLSYANTVFVTQRFVCSSEQHRVATVCRKIFTLTYLVSPNT
jgi:hypothetical protein